jgi:KAP family P-loop domain
VHNFESFTVLLDDPAAAPALRYPECARASAQIIRHSDRQFAIGIFGDWDSGKTTLIRAIERELAKDRSVVTVEFTAWQYERESDLIVALLDRLREELSAERARTSEERARAQRAAETVGRAAKALVAATKLVLLRPFHRPSWSRGWWSSRRLSTGLSLSSSCSVLRRRLTFGQRDRPPL